MAVNPTVVLADEPTGDLDSATAKDIQQLLKGMADQLNVAMVVATHDITFMGLADRIKEIVDGRLKDQGVDHGT